MMTKRIFLALTFNFIVSMLPAVILSFFLSFPINAQGRGQLRRFAGEKGAAAIVSEDAAPRRDHPAGYAAHKNVPPDDLSQWRPLAPLEGGPVPALASEGGRVYAGTLLRGVFVSADNGRTWREANAGLGNLTINALGAAGSNVLAATNGGLYRSGDGGQSWTRAAAGGLSVRSVLASGASVFIGTSAGRIFRSTDNGQSFNERGAVANNPIVYALAALGENLFAGTSRGLFRSADSGQTWTAVRAGLPNNGAPSVRALAVNDNTLYLGANTDYRDANNNLLPHVYSSNDAGQTWAGVGAAIRFVLGSETFNGTVRSLSYDDGRLYAGTEWGLAVFDGQQWGEAVSRGLTLGDRIYARWRGNNATLLGTIGGVFALAGDGQSWAQSNRGLTATVVVVTISGDTLYANAGFSGLFRSEDNGQNWTALDPIVDGAGRRLATGVLVARNNSLFLSVDFGGIFRSNDSGASWTPVNSGLRSTGFAASLDGGDNELYALTATGFLHKLNADGNGWTQVNATAIPADTIAVSGSNIYAYAYLGANLLRSTDGGATFAPINLGAPVTTVIEVAAHGSNVYCSAIVNGVSGVFVSTDSGVNFTRSQSSLRIDDFEPGGGALYGLSIPSGVYYSTNNGRNWTPINAGLPTRIMSFSGLAVKGDTVLAPTQGFGVFAAVNPHLQPATLANVSAASFAPGGDLAPESIAAAFGSALATSAQVATTTTLPAVLGGTRVIVRDSTGAERNAPLFFVAPGQINYQIPPGAAAGKAVIIAFSGDGQTSVGETNLASVAPGLFSANASGQGVAAAVALRLKADGTQSFEPVAQFDAAQQRFVAVPIDLGAETDQVFLILYGAGLRFRTALRAVTATIGGVNSEALFAGAAPGFTGLDQVNVRLPRSLEGRGEVEIALSVDGKAANSLRVNIR